MRALPLLLLGLLAGACTEPPSGPDASFPADLGLGHLTDDDGGADGGAIATAAVGFQLDPAHTGALPGERLHPPLQKSFTIDLGGAISYPLIADGRVFVIVASAAGPRLYGLDGESGATRFGPVPLGGSGWAAMAAGGGRIFTLDSDGVLAAFDAASGAARFSRTLPGGPGAFGAPPSAANGRVFVTSGAAAGGAVYAVDEQSGALLWSSPIAGGSHASPAISPDGVFVTAGCAQAWDLSPSTGALRWFHAESCAGAGGLTPLYAAGRLWVRASSGGLLLDAQSGLVAGSFSAKVAPAVDEAASLALLFDGTTLRAIDVPSGTVAWSFVGDGALRSAPIAAGGFVYIGSGAGLLYALDETSGHLAFTATLPAPVLAPDESDLSRPLTGLAAGDGLLVVPTGHLLSAYH